MHLSYSASLLDTHLVLFLKSLDHMIASLSWDHINLAETGKLLERMLLSHCPIDETRYITEGQLSSMDGRVSVLESVVLMVLKKGNALWDLERLKQRKLPCGNLNSTYNHHYCHQQHQYCGATIANIIMNIINSDFIINLINIMNTIIIVIILQQCRTDIPLTKITLYYWIDSNKEVLIATNLQYT